MRLFAVLFALVFARAAAALPQYANASGRTCGNCHISPTFRDPKGWHDPELASRKCNLSCTSCHVNPSGGGLRNTAGRYFGLSTLSMIPLEERSYSDYRREVVPPATIAELRAMFDSGRRTEIPSSFEELERSAGQRGGFSTFGKPLLSPSELALWDGRYGDLNADPLLAFGADVRLAYWSGSETFFPMQADLHAALHPVEHLTAMATLAGRGRTSRLLILGQDRTPVFMRNAFLMAHELPYMVYAKAGIFLPAFGTHIDDHTSFIRRYFDMDVSTSDDTVAGLEVGLAPNYPFASASVFRGMTGGYGAAVNLGWRDLGFSASAHGMIKRRELEEGGDLDAAGVAFGVNPGYYLEALPISILGELSFGRRGDVVTGREVGSLALYGELSWLLFNGFTARLKYDLGSRDLANARENEQRFSIAADFAPFPGVTLITQARLLFPAGGADPRPDLFTHLHLWF